MARRATMVGLIWLLTACGTLSPGGYYKEDGPPRRDAVDVASISDAIPRHEPLSNTGNDPYTVDGKTYYPRKDARGYRERGIASWYGRMFHGRRTSSGEPFDMYAMTAAHPTLPLPSYVRVRNLRNRKEVVVRVNDRGPFLHDRLIDLSYASAHKLGLVATGTGLVEVSAVMPGDVSETTRHAPPLVEHARPAPELYVQVGAFSRRENADRLHKRLQESAYGPVLVQQARVGGVRIHRLRIGPIATVDEADRVAARLRRRGYDPRIIID